MNFLWQPKKFAQDLARHWMTGYMAVLGTKAKCQFIHPGNKLIPGPVAMYGIQPETFLQWLQTRIEGRDFYYIDNAYLSPGHGEGKFVRITKNALQHTGLGESDGERLKRHKVILKPWGVLEFGVILITCQSGWWYVQHGTTLQAWLDGVIAKIRDVSDRPIKVRLKPKAKYQQPPNTVLATDVVPADAQIPFEEDLKGAYCVVTHSSNTAVEAIMAGVPAFVTGDSAAWPIAHTDLKEIENPEDFTTRWDYDHDSCRINWLGVLADNQWTPAEIRSGLAWKMLNKGE